jgi:hypothetical protein
VPHSWHAITSSPAVPCAVGVTSSAVAVVMLIPNPLFSRLEREASYQPARS